MCDKNDMAINGTEFQVTANKKVQSHKCNILCGTDWA